MIKKLISFRSFFKKKEDEYKPIESDIHIRPEIWKEIELGIGHRDNKKVIKEEVLTESAKEVTDNHKALVKHYDKYDTAHRMAIGHYTDVGYRKINDHLRKTKNKPKSLFKYFKQIKHLDSTMKAHKTPHDIIVHSGVSQLHMNNLIKDHKSEGPIQTTNHGYTSSSLDPNVARSFAHDNRHDDIHSTLKIHVPKGHHGAYVAHHSYNSHEREFILPRGSKLHIQHKPKITKTRDFGIHHEYTAHVVSDKK